MTDAIRSDARGPYLVRDPRSKLPVTVDWSAWLTQEGTTITGSQWEADDGLTLEDETNTTTVAQVTVSGGTSGTVYELRNTITCANGSQDSRSLRVVVRDR